MNEVIVTLDKFKPRDYQKPIFKALEKDGYKKLVVIWPRRARQGYGWFSDSY